MVQTFYFIIETFKITNLCLKDPLLIKKYFVLVDLNVCCIYQSIFRHVPLTSELMYISFVTSCNHVT